MFLMLELPPRTNHRHDYLLPKAGRKSGGGVRKVKRAIVGRRVWHLVPDLHEDVRTDERVGSAGGAEKCHSSVGVTTLISREQRPERTLRGAVEGCIL